MLEYRLDPNNHYGLPKMLCNYCGHIQSVFAMSSLSCSKCHRYFHHDAFHITRDVKRRLHYANGGVCYAAGN